MQQITQPNAWSCTAAAFAMALNISVERFWELVGHDGSEIILPNLPDPMGRRGIHIQEAIDACWAMTTSATPFELWPTGVRAKDDVTPVTFNGGNVQRIDTHLALGVGVAECMTRKGTGHTVAFGGGVIFDPSRMPCRANTATATIESCLANGLGIYRIWEIR